MKKIIVLLAVVLLIPGIALAESVNIYGDENHKIIYRISDDGDVRTSNVYKVSDGGYVEFDDRGNSRMIFDNTSDRARDRDED